MTLLQSKPQTMSDPTEFFGPVGYGRVMALDRTRHAGWGMRASSSLTWSADVNAVPINVDEFGVAALHMPLAFVKDISGAYDSAAILTVQAGRNFFVDHRGNWRQGAYVPAYLRRFPFCTRATPDRASPYLVCVREDGIEPNSAAPLIDSVGKLTPHWQPWQRLIEAFEQSRQRTRQFINELTDLDLLVPCDAVRFLPGGSKERMTGLHRVDEPRLRSLTAGILRDLLDGGQMRAIHAHLLSLEHLQRLHDEQVAGHNSRLENA